ncbi:MAG: serine-type D-Ala-D-Ala carboxypeptidase, partial [Rhodanobacter sp.]
PLQSVPLIAVADAPAGGFFSRLWDSILLWFHSGTSGSTPVTVGK